MHERQEDGESEETKQIEERKGERRGRGNKKGKDRESQKRERVNEKEREKAYVGREGNKSVRTENECIQKREEYVIGKRWDGGGRKERGGNDKQEERRREGMVSREVWREGGKR